MSKNVEIIIVEKTGVLKKTTVKEFNESDLYKKCGFKKDTNFCKQTEWSIKKDKQKYVVSVFAKKDGKPNSENKYDFPPPIDNALFFGSCAIICQKYNDDKSLVYYPLTVKLWNSFYEKLFGGFEDLALIENEDELEIDELENVPSEKKTKQGYLKDGFVVDSDADSQQDDCSDSNYDDDDEDDDNSNCDKKLQENDNAKIVIEDIGSELSEDDYDYDSDALV
jgi:hypothetical protein